VVVISTAHGLKFVDFKALPREAARGDRVAEAEPGHRAAGELREVRDRMLREIEQRFGA
jgi:hypothetical protein